MTHKHRIKALECIQEKRQQAAAPDPARLRQFAINLWRAYGEPGEPPPEMSDAELLAWAGSWEEKINRAFDDQAAR